MKACIAGLVLMITGCTGSCARESTTVTRSEQTTNVATDTSPAAVTTAATPPTNKLAPSKRNDPNKRTKPQPPPSRPRLSIPQRPTRLAVPGYNDAVFVGPEDEQQNGHSIAGSPPKTYPVMIVLHGNYDRAEWQCDTWSDVEGFTGWIVCPAGVPSPWAEPGTNRWTYKGGAASVRKEIEAVLNALSNLFPNRVSSENGILVGFSLGANLAPAIAIKSPSRFSTLFLVEGGLKQISSMRRLLKKSGIRAIGLAMGTGNRRREVKGIMKQLKQQHLTVVYVDMPGAGHNYGTNFTTDATPAIQELISKQKKDHYAL